MWVVLDREGRCEGHLRSRDFPGVSGRCLSRHWKEEVEKAEKGTPSGEGVRRQVTTLSLERKDGGLRGCGRVG